jgi:hypothetical protein
MPPYGNLVREVAFSFCFPILGPSGVAGRSPPNSSFLERLHLVSLPSPSTPYEMPLSVSCIPGERSRVLADVPAQALALVLALPHVPHSLRQSHIPILFISTLGGNCNFQEFSWIKLQITTTPPKRGRSSRKLPIKPIPTPCEQHRRSARHTPQ